MKVNELLQNHEFGCKINLVVYEEEKEMKWSEEAYNSLLTSQYFNADIVETWVEDNVLFINCIPEDRILLDDLGDVVMMGSEVFIELINKYYNPARFILKHINRKNPFEDLGSRERLEDYILEWCREFRLYLTYEFLSELKDNDLLKVYFCLLDSEFMNNLIKYYFLGEEEL